MMTKTPGEISSVGTVSTFLKVGTCSETLCNVLDRALGEPLKREERATAPLAGGIMQHGYQCGMLWGAALAAGAQAYRLLGPGPQAEAAALTTAQRLVEAFRAQTNCINCHEITDLDKSSTNIQMVMYFLIRGGTIGCMRMAAKFALAARSEIDSSLSENHVEPPAPPVSCSALLARKAGLSDMHAAMAAGLAGGIGLSGGCCGALGAAIWIIGMNGDKENGKVDYKSPRAAAAIERFLECTDYKFECSEIVGRKFEGVADHACYLRDGGCAKIIEELASEISSGEIP